jgi:hypothetical protein
MSSLDIAPYPEGAPAFGRDRCRIRRRLRVSFRRAGSCTFWRLGFRQFSFHRIARVPWRTVPDTWTRPPVSCHALFPLTFRRQVRHRTQGHPSNPSRLRRGYNEAPRGALRICRGQGLSAVLGAEPHRMSVSFARTTQNSFPSGSTPSWLTLTICPARPGPVLDAGAGLEGPVRAGERDRHRDRPERAGRHVLHAGHRSQDGQEPRAS